MSRRQTHDLIIVGGGLVGLTCALAVSAQTDLRIAIIEPQLLTRPALGRDLRVYALNMAVRNSLVNLGVWPVILANRCAAFSQIQIMDDASGKQLRFTAQEVQESALGYIVEQNVLLRALLEGLQQQAKVDFFPTRAQAVDVAPQQVQLLLQDTTRLTAKVIIGADGACSWLREQQAIPVRQADYGHRALVTTVRTEKSHALTARQVFLADGPLAFLPLEEPTMCSIVWSSSPDKVQSLQAMADAEFEQALTQAFASRLGEMELVDRRLSFPLLRLHAQHYVQARVALVGDAAHTIHPLAGQGANLGVLDAISLAQVIMETAAKGRDIGSLQTLLRYQRWRKEATLTMLAAMDGLKYAFAMQTELLVKARGLGLQLIEHIPGLKSALIYQAMGLTQELPSLAKGTFAEL
jgi:2-polyprenylphenol 6-hydroxylase